MAYLPIELALEPEDTTVVGDIDAFIEQYVRRLKNSEPHAVGPPERGRARSTNMRHHSSSTLNCSLFARRNGYEPTHPIPFPRATRSL
jgi:hypothetical protein